MRIPKPVAEAAKMRQGDRLEFEVTGPGTIRIRTEESRPTLAQLLRGITSENRHQETDWGNPVGNELW